jgi:hypothetical protein
LFLFPISSSCMQNVQCARFYKQGKIITLLLYISIVTGSLYLGWLLCTGTVTSPGWIINLVRVDGLSPAQWEIVCIFFFDLGPVSFLSRVWPVLKRIKIKNEIFFQNYFKKISVIFRRFFYWILLSIGLYFYIVKIQIRY